MEEKQQNQVILTCRLNRVEGSQANMLKLIFIEHSKKEMYI